MWLSCHVMSHIMLGVCHVTVCPWYDVCLPHLIRLTRTLCYSMLIKQIESSLMWSSCHVAVSHITLGVSHVTVCWRYDVCVILIWYDLHTHTLPLCSSPQTQRVILNVIVVSCSNESYHRWSQSCHSVLIVRCMLFWFNSIFTHTLPLVAPEIQRIVLNMIVVSCSNESDHIGSQSRHSALMIWCMSFWFDVTHTHTATLCS